MLDSLVAAFLVECCSISNILPKLYVWLHPANPFLYIEYNMSRLLDVHSLSSYSIEIYFVLKPFFLKY